MGLPDGALSRRSRIEEAVSSRYVDGGGLRFSRLARQNDVVIEELSPLPKEARGPSRVRMVSGLRMDRIADGSRARPVRACESGSAIRISSVESTDECGMRFSDEGIRQVVGASIERASFLDGPKISDVPKVGGDCGARRKQRRGKHDCGVAAKKLSSVSISHTQEGPFNYGAFSLRYIMHPITFLLRP